MGKEHHGEFTLRPKGHCEELERHGNLCGFTVLNNPGFHPLNRYRCVHAPLLRYVLRRNFISNLEKAARWIPAKRLPE